MSIAALSPDLVLTNATVLTADAKDTRAEAVAVWNGRIGAVGLARRRGSSRNAKFSAGSGTAPIPVDSPSSKSGSSPILSEIAPPAKP